MTARPKKPRGLQQERTICDVCRVSPVGPRLQVAEKPGVTHCHGASCTPLKHPGRYGHPYETVKDSRGDESGVPINSVSVSAEWHRLTSVVAISAENYEVTRPINRTQTHSYRGLRPPSPRLVTAQHAGVLDRLSHAGVRVVRIKPTPGLPYQFNVRDAGVVVHDQLIFARMTYGMRGPEPTLLSREVQPTVRTASISRGRLEGGDVLVAGTEVYVGLGERTDREGYLAFRRLLPKSMKTTPIRLTAGTLHLDVALNMISPRLGLIYRPAIAGELPDSLRGVSWIDVTAQEFAEQAVNVLAIDESTVMLDSRQERLRTELKNRGVNCLTADLDEITKVGGGIRCMTLPLERSM